MRGLVVLIVFFGVLAITLLVGSLFVSAAITNGLLAAILVTLFFSNSDSTDAK